MTMNIGFDAKRFFFNYTGLGNYSRQTIDYLSQYKKNINILLYTPIIPDKLEFIKGMDSNIQIKTPQGIAKVTPNLWRRNFITNNLIADKIDIYHGLSNELPKSINKKQIKSIVTIHDLIFLIYPQTYALIDRKIYYYKFKQACIQSDIIIATSQNTKNDIIKYFKIPEHKIKVIYQCIDPIFHFKQNQISKDKVRIKYNLPDNFILNVGTIEERKNIGVIIKAIKDIKDCNLVIVGKLTPKYGKYILSLIERFNLQKRVLILQNVYDKNELSSLYQLSDFVVMPSFYEGFGIPLVEAMASEKAIIAADASCFREVAGNSAVYCDPTDAVSFSEKIQLLLNDKALRISLATEAQNQLELFNPEHMANKLYNTYLELYNKTL